MIIRPMTLAGLALSLLAGTTQAAQTVTIANWSSYIADDTLANFTRQTGIQTTYDLVDSNEILDFSLRQNSNRLAPTDQGDGWY